MKSILLLFLVGVLAVACSDNADVAETNSPAAAGTGGEVVEGEAALATFYDYMENADSNFSRGYFQEASPPAAIDTLAAMPVEKDHLAQYDSFLVYNTDRSKAIDPYSHSFLLSKKGGKTTLTSGSPDTELAWIDVRAGKRQRLFYFGPSYIFLDAKWKDDATVLFAISELIGTNKISPEIWEVDINKFTKRVSRYPDSLAIDVAGYRAQQQAAH
jgi:hypothetical protein